MLVKKDIRPKKVRSKKIRSIKVLGPNYLLTQRNKPSLQDFGCLGLQSRPRALERVYLQVTGHQLDLLEEQRQILCLKGAVTESHCVCYIKLELNGSIIWGLTQLFFLDLVSPKKCIMSDRCWFFTLKMVNQESGSRDLSKM